MSEARVKTFVCDQPGCRSNATIHPTDNQTHEDALVLRGWGVSADNTKHYCPIHKERVVECAVAK